MTKEFISISDAVTRYKISQNKLRKLVKDNKGTNHVQTVEITGKHGFKYLISVAYLDAMFTPVNKVETSLKQGRNEHKTSIKQDNQADNQKQSNNNQADNRLIKQLQETNKQLSDTVTSQQTTIKDLTNTLQEQNKIIVAQSLQIHRLSEPTTTERWNEPPPNENIKQGSGTSKIELLIITILVVCIVATIVFLIVR
jgi:DNA anti-recombination protein RmuC